MNGKRKFFPFLQNGFLLPQSVAQDGVYQSSQAYGREIHGFIHSGVVRHAQQKKLAQPQLENKTRFHVQPAFPEGSDDVVQPGLVAQYAEDQSLHQVPVCRWKRGS